MSCELCRVDNNKTAATKKTEQLHAKTVFSVFPLPPSDAPDPSSSLFLLLAVMGNSMDRSDMSKSPLDGTPVVRTDRPAPSCSPPPSSSALMVRLRSVDVDVVRRAFIVHDEYCQHIPCDDSANAKAKRALSLMARRPVWSDVMEKRTQWYEYLFFFSQPLNQFVVQRWPKCDQVQRCHAVLCGAVLCAHCTLC
jgi:hypothetical protein